MRSNISQKIPLHVASKLQLNIEGQSQLQNNTYSTSKNRFLILVTKWLDNQFHHSNRSLGCFCFICLECSLKNHFVWLGEIRQVLHVILNLFFVCLFYLGFGFGYYFHAKMGVALLFCNIWLKKLVYLIISQTSKNWSICQTLIKHRFLWHLIQDPLSDSVSESTL